MIQEPLDVGIEHLSVPVPLEFQHLFHGLMAIACRPKTIRVVVKDPLEKRTEEEPKHLLSNPVANGGDTQRTGGAVPLGDMDTTQGLGPKAPVLETPHQGQQVLREITLKQPNADLVDPGRAPVTSDVPKRGLEQGQGDPSGQRMSLDLDQLSVLSC